MKQSGILMHITSLPGAGGIGSLGPEAHRFADALKAAGMSIWQVLPCGPTGYGESPYQSPSVFAGNPLLISAELLQRDGFLHATAEDLAEGLDPERVDFDAVRARKESMLRRAYAESGKQLEKDVLRFTESHAWLPDYALFMALKKHFGYRKWNEWPDNRLVCRKRRALAEAEASLRDECGYHRFVQYLFYRQWEELHAHCRRLGILLFGDMPIYVAEDSADAWAHPDVFQLDRRRIPTRVAGVPPDYFSEDGQLWGNPLYRWNWLRYVRRYDWWTDRMKAMHELYDMIRIDHFIGFANYWSVPYGSPNARHGKWIKGPGYPLFRKLNEALPGLRIVAEDLGETNDRVRRLLAQTGYPGMRLLTFGFGGGDDNIHHPDHLSANTVLYTGTHDNDTCLSWLKHASPEELRRVQAWRVFSSPEEGVREIIAGCFQAICDTCIIPMQDILGLDGRARMNLPGTVGGNWAWRMKSGAFTAAHIAWLRELNQESGRLNQHD